MTNTKNCPFCDEEIKINAIKCKHCGSMLSGDTPTGSMSANPEALIRNVLGDRYEIRGVLGKGGMATVYRAEQRNLGREVAIKVIHQNLVHDEEFIKRFTREAKVSASLSHRNIVTVHDVGAAGSVHYMTMELLDGITLNEYLQQNGKLSSGEVVKLLLPIAKALDYIHGKKLVHRDLKSSNIFITKEGRSVLTDFGIVYAGNETKLSRAGAIVGTPEYMSPEQAEGNVELDYRSDVYSLGVIMYECLTGRVPFHSDNPLATIHKVLHDIPVSPKDRELVTPAWLSKLVMHCLEKDRTKRLQSAGELAKHLEARSYHTKKNWPTTKATVKISPKELKETKRQKETRIQDLKSDHSRSKPNKDKLILATIVVVLILLGGMVAYNYYQKDQQQKAYLAQSIAEGDVYYEQQQYEKALEAYQRGLTIKEDDPVLKQKISLTNEAIEEMQETEIEQLLADKERQRESDQLKAQQQLEAAQEIEKQRAADRLRTQQQLVVEQEKQRVKEKVRAEKERLIVEEKKRIASKIYKTEPEKEPIEEEVEMIFTKVEDQPTPIGGISAFYQYVQKKMEYPAQARRMGIVGKVFVQFVVDKDGSIKEVKSVKGIGAGCDQEAENIIKGSPKWKPGRQRGKPVKVRMILPITFKL